MSIYIENETETGLDFDYEDVIRKVINYSLDFIQCPYETEVNVVITDNDGIHQVNKEYRNIDRPTDVLSFPMIEYEEAGNFDIIDENNEDVFNPETGELVLGDIMISIEKVKEQALDYGHSELRELAFLTAHSMLHLFGYDHMEEEERKVMEEAQRSIMEGLKIFR